MIPYSSTFRLFDLFFKSLIQTTIFATVRIYSYLSPTLSKTLVCGSNASCLLVLFTRADCEFLSSRRHWDSIFKYANSIASSVSPVLMAKKWRRLFPLFNFDKLHCFHIFHFVGVLCTLYFTHRHRVRKDFTWAHIVLIWQLENLKEYTNFNKNCGNIQCMIKFGFD